MTRDEILADPLKGPPFRAREAENALLFQAMKALRRAGLEGYPNLIRDPGSPLFPWPAVYDAETGPDGPRLVLRPRPGLAGSPAIAAARNVLARLASGRVAIGAAPTGDGLRWF